MVDLARIKRNVGKMVSLGAPEADIDAYIASEGVSLEEVRAFKPSSAENFRTQMLNAAERGEMSSNVKVATKAHPEQAMQPSLMGATAATMSGLVESIPIAGPMLQNASDNILALGSGLTGKNPLDTLREIKGRRQQIEQANPIANVAGQVAGSLGGYGAAMKVAPHAMGVAGNVGQRMLNTGLSTLGIEAAHGMAQGQAPTEALGNAATPAGISALIPGAGSLIGKGIKATGNQATRIVGGILNPEAQAQRVASKALVTDIQSGQRVMNAADAAAAQRAGQPIVNADRGGMATRQLARTASNISDEAKGRMTDLVSDRFAQQGPRAVDFLKRLTGGATDDIAYSQSIREVAQAVNKPAYEQAFNNPGAQSVFNRPIAELMQSDTFRTAIKAAEKRGTDKAAVSGFKAVRNPFVFADDGRVGLARNPDGSQALPTLQFWDQVKRNLDGMIGVAQRQGDNALTADLTGMKQKLTGALDQAVPDYAQARAGAAGFFGAEDAIEAGRMFARQPKAIPEAARAYGKFAPAEKAAFGVGYSSELIDTIKASRDRVNVINQVFGSQASREMAELALGSQKAKELEAFVRVETIMDTLRQAVSGGSTTANQLYAMGVVGGGTALLTGDLQNGVNAAVILGAGRAGMRVLGKTIDQKVMAKVAEMLSSSDPSVMNRVIANAQLSKKHMEALEAIGRGLEIAARGAALQMAS